MKIIRLEPLKTLRLIAKSKLCLRFFAGFSFSLRAFARPAGDSHQSAREKAKPAKEFYNRLSLYRLCLIILIVSALAISSSIANAQQAKGELRGQVVDEFGGLIVGATVTLTDATGVAKTVATNNEGIYLFSGLAPGTYTLRVEARGFSLYQNADVEVKTGSRESLNIKLTVALEKQEVKVGAETSLSTASENNATALVLNSAELESLPDDPDDLAAALQAIAGPSAGPSGGEIFVDGFAGGRVPTKNTIREVRINSNPFSAEYRNLGFGRIEIFTKPGTDKFHGQANASFSNQSFNSRNPFASNRAPYKYLIYGVSLSGPVKAKRASFFLDFEQRDINDNSIISATVLDPALQPTPFGLSVVVPQHRTTFSPRFDYQINQKNTLVARYTFLHQRQQNAGIGNFSLLSRAYSTAYTEQTVQLTETAVINPRAVNETRFQYSHQENHQNGDNSTPTINVLDAFIGGGASVGQSSNNQDRFEFQNYTTFVVNRQTFKAGVRLRDVRVRDVAPVNFGGTYTFAGGSAPALDANNQIVFSRDQQTGNLVPSLIEISSLERYRRTLLFARQGLTPEEVRLRGGGATQLSLAGGNPEARVNQAEFNLFIQDEWTLRPNLTLSLGLRYEAQSNVQNRFNFAPRIAFAYAPNAAAGKTKTVIRGGFGIFFDRFSESLSLQAKHFESEQQFISLDQNILGLFPALPSLAALINSTASRTSVQLDPRLQLPYMMQGAINIERQLPYKFVFTATLLSARALHLLRSRNINAPLPETNIRPLGDARGNIFEYESSGRLNQNQLILSLRNPQSSKHSIVLTYLLNKAMSDTDGPESFPVNSYDLRSEYGRSDLD
ncbi:MAG TPA: carboxypeptidase regulatory-like domain-containing protein, partial [Pyrinomonadaceae bacterium]|nr:carboxypeptidase regulatory-like domain-containing protein [Pyrinomonadaceae bacterium]